jgi:hypothetical protein
VAAAEWTGRSCRVHGCDEVAEVAAENQDLLACHRYHLLGRDVNVRVISASDLFLFNPSLIWVPFGLRAPKDISFPVAPTFERHGVMDAGTTGW